VRRHHRLRRGAGLRPGPPAPFDARIRAGAALTNWTLCPATARQPRDVVESDAMSTRATSTTWRKVRAALAPLPALVAALLPAAVAAATPGSPGATIEQRAAACIACHGRQGSSSNAGYYPRLSGKPAGYLFDQLQSFRDGRRFHSDMVYMVRHMSDDNLRELAGYFAGLSMPYPPVSPVTDASATMLERGRQLAHEGDAARSIPACVSCHGAALMGVQPGIPPLLGLPRLYIASQLGAWLTGDRHAPAPDCMAEVGSRLDTADINAVASWLAVQPVPADTRAAAAPAAPLPLACSAMRQAARH